MKHTKDESSSSSEVFAEQGNYHSTSDSSDDNHYTKKRKYKSYEEISGEFKKDKTTNIQWRDLEGGGSRILVIYDEKLLLDI